MRSCCGNLEFHTRITFTFSDIHMFRLCAISIFLTLTATGGICQNPNKTASTPILPAGIKIYRFGSEATPPVFLDAEIPVSNSEKCPGRQEGSVLLTIVVDAHGNARPFGYQRALGNGLDALAWKLVEVDQFKPADHQGTPVAAFLLADMKLEACAENTRLTIKEKNKPSCDSALNLSSDSQRSHFRRKTLIMSLAANPAQ